MMGETAHPIATGSAAARFVEERMKSRNYLPLILSLFCATCTYAQTDAATTPAATQHNLMPVPLSARFNPGKLPIGKSFTVAVRGRVDPRLQAGIDRAVRRIEARTVIELARGLATDTATATLVVESSGPGKVVPSVDEDESYSLEVSATQAILKAPTTVGVLRGLHSCNCSIVIVTAISSPLFRFRIARAFPGVAC